MTKRHPEFGFGIFLAILTVFLQTQAFSANDDLFLQSRLDQKSTSWIIDKVRMILVNSELSDGLTDTTTLSEDTEIPLNDFSDKPEFSRLKDMVSKVFRVDPKGAFLRIRIPKIHYKVHTLHARPESFEIIDPSIRLKATALLQGVDIALTEGVQLDFVIPNPKTGTSDAYLTGFLKPVSVEVPKSLEPAGFGVDLEATRDHEFRFKLVGSDLASLPDYVDRHMEEIMVLGSASGLPLSADDLSINPVVVRLNSLSRSISFDEFRPVVQKNLKNILTQVLRQVGSSLKESIGPAILKTVFSKTIPSALSLSSDSIFTRYITSFFGRPDHDQLLLSVAGDLCTNELFLKFGDACSKHMRPYSPIRALSIEDKSRAKEEIRQKIASGNADVALSVSEDYLNRLLRTTIDAKLWDEMLKEENLELGPKGAFVVFNQSGSDPEIYLDILYKGGKGLQSILINPRHPLRFPLRMSTKMVFEKRDGMPFLVISIARLMSDAYEIMNGIREYDLPSDLIPGLRRKIASMIIRMASEIEGRNAVEMELPVFKGLGLENTWHEPSAFGRLNLYFKL
ncbi:MAG: hypothetical protein KGP28_11710 [Bdellovibrionales bacterium]|nr:hypothetical protein [Bdellovibrionales bacterium]